MAPPAEADRLKIPESNWSGQSCSPWSSPQSNQRSVPGKQTVNYHFPSLDVCRFQLSQFKLMNLIKEVDSVPGAIVKAVAQGQQRQNVLRFRAQERRERRVRSCKDKN
jgi:hypothetical protein